MRKSIRVIDLFAGPGGLGEGFSSLNVGSKPKFKVVLSIEKEANAHATLELRSFFRQFKKNEVPEDYYRLLRQEISQDDLYQRFPKEAGKARQEARLATLGEIDKNIIDKWIKDALQGEKDDWLLIGGPPCQAYSLAGRSRNKGISGYKPEDDERHYLYKEYLRIIAKHWPSVFVMENVKGILSSKVDGKRIFENIFNDLVNPGRAVGNDDLFKYRIYSIVESRDRPMDVNDKYTIKSEDYGIPQARHRVILLGIRDSFNLNNHKPDILEPVKDQLTTWDVISDLPRIRSGLSTENNGKSWAETINEVRASEWYNEINDRKREKLDEKLSEINRESGKIHELGALYMETDKTLEPKLKEWYIDERLRGVCNHITRNHMAGDLHRYFYNACFAEIHGKSASLNDLPKQLLPAHKNVNKSLKTRNFFSDRFRVQVSDKPSTTITSHIAKDGHYYIHPDPVQCRSLSVREAARLQTFPDNYYFCGSRTAQYTQVGNAVPPLLAKKIAMIVSTFLSNSRRKHG